MTRLLIVVEGETEEEFVNECLRPHLCDLGYRAVDARLMGSARSRERRGGVRAWSSVRKDLLRFLREDRERLVGLMVDFYAMPKDDHRGWPGRADANQSTAAEKAKHIEGGLLEDICLEMGRSFDRSRFIPYVVMHEFEALLFSDCESFARAVYRPKICAALQAIATTFVSPEEIDDSPETAPSKRIEG